MIHLPHGHSRPTASMTMAIKSLIVLYCHISLQFLWHKSSRKMQNIAFFHRNRIFRTLLYRKWLGQRFMGQGVRPWWTERPHSFYSCLWCDVCWRSLRIKLGVLETIRSGCYRKKRKIILIVSSQMHRECDQEFITTRMGCILKIIRDFTCRLLRMRTEEYKTSHVHKILRNPCRVHYKTYVVLT